MKKILSVIMAALLMLSLTACGTPADPQPTATPNPQTEEEQLITGLWNATAVMAQGEITLLPSAYCAMEVKEDYTAISSILNSETGSSDKTNLTWKYDSTSEDMYIYVFVNEQGGVLTAAYSKADGGLILMAEEENGILFEKVS